MISHSPAGVNNLFLGSAGLQHSEPEMFSPLVLKLLRKGQSVFQIAALICLLELALEVCDLVE